MAATLLDCDLLADIPDTCYFREYGTTNGLIYRNRLAPFGARRVIATAVKVSRTGSRHEVGIITPAPNGMFYVCDSDGNYIESNPCGGYNL